MTSFAAVYQMMKRLTEVFDKITLDDIKDKTCIRDIAQTIKERYVTPDGNKIVQRPNRPTLGLYLANSLVFFATLI